MHRLLPLILLTGCHALVPLDSPFATDESGVADGPVVDSGVVADAPVVDGPADGGNVVKGDGDDPVPPDFGGVVKFDAPVSQGDGSVAKGDAPMVSDGSVVVDYGITVVDGGVCLTTPISDWACVAGRSGCVASCGDYRIACFEDVCDCVFSAAVLDSCQSSWSSTGCPKCEAAGVCCKAIFGAP